MHEYLPIYANLPIQYNLDIYCSYFSDLGKINAQYLDHMEHCWYDPLFCL